MSSTPTEAETHEVTLSRDEQWVVHHVLATHIDEALDDEQSPPAWMLAVFETIETDDCVVTDDQLRQLRDTLETYLDRSETPQRDHVHGSTALAHFDGVLDAEIT